MYLKNYIEISLSTKIQPEAYLALVYLFDSSEAKRKALRFPKQLPIFKKNCSIEINQNCF